MIRPCPLKHSPFYPSNSQRRQILRIRKEKNMMQSRFPAIAAKSNGAFSFAGLRRGLVSFHTGPTAHDNKDETEKSEDVEKPENAKTDYKTKPSRGDSAMANSGKEAENESFASPRLKSTVIGQSSKPITQQKRTHTDMTVLDDVSCIGIDGTPLPEEKEDRRKDREEQEVDDRDYYKYHKASPLSEIEFADTRKPITRATDGTADSGALQEVIGWLPEQLDTAEEALRRATEIWKENAMRGDPDAPHSRVLRTLRGEWF